MSAAGNGQFDLKHRSRALTEGRDRAAARAYLKGIGYDDEALSKPIIGVANTWIETMPCNFHLRALAKHVKEGIKAAGGTPMEFNTIAISDGITMGTAGMKTSLVSREVIADSIELVTLGHLFDAVIALGACDKTLPGTVMALARLDAGSKQLGGEPPVLADYRATILEALGRDEDALRIWRELLPRWRGAESNRMFSTRRAGMAASRLASVCEAFVLGGRDPGEPAGARGRAECRG